MLGTRTAAWAKSIPTAKDYVQDGLVAMWDGIENAGYGVHGPSATVWKDLVSEVDWVKQNTELSYPIFSADSAVFDGTNCFVNITPSIVSAWNGGKITIEACGATEFLATSTDQHIWELNLGIRNEHWFRKDSQYITWGQPKFTNYDSLSRLNTPRVSSVLFDGVNLMQYIDGEYKVSATPIISGSVSSSPCFLIGGGRLFTGEVKNIRIYNRVLTAEEIEHNYEIDKARFNLP